MSDNEQEKMLVALAAIAQGNMDAVVRDRNEKLAFVKVAQKRGFLIWGGPQGYRLTQKGKRFLERHSGATISSRTPKVVFGTRAALAAGLLLVFGISGANRFNGLEPGGKDTRVTSATAVKPPSDWNSVINAPTIAGDQGGRGLAATALDLPDNRQEPFRLGDTTAGSQAKNQSTGVSPQHVPGQSSKKPYERRHHAKLTKKVKNETHPRGLVARDPAWNAFGYGWARPLPSSPWPYGWTR